MERSGYLNQPCLSAVAKLLFTDSLARALLTGIGIAGLLAAVIWLGIRLGRDSTHREFDRTFAVAIVASLLAAGYLRTHDLVLLLLPLGVILDRSAVLRSSPVERSLLAYAGIAFALPYALLLGSVFAPVFRASVWHISSTVSVLVSLFTCGQGRPVNQAGLAQAP
jgi:hypothetical protein